MQEPENRVWPTFSYIQAGKCPRVMTRVVATSQWGGTTLMHLSGQMSRLILAHSEVTGQQNILYIYNYKLWQKLWVSTTLGSKKVQIYIFTHFPRFFVVHDDRLWRNLEKKYIGIQAVSSKFKRCNEHSLFSPKNVNESGWNFHLLQRGLKWIEWKLLKAGNEIRL